MADRMLFDNTHADVFNDEYTDLGPTAWARLSGLVGSESCPPQLKADIREALSMIDMSANTLKAAVRALNTMRPS